MRSQFTRALVLVDSVGLVHADRAGLAESKRAHATPTALCRTLGVAPDAGLVATIEGYRPTILVGTTGVPGSFSEAAVRSMAAACDRPIIMPLSNPTTITEAHPTDLLRWTDGRALIATGSPFPPSMHAGGERQVGQANNVFIFPGLGMGAIVSEARQVSDSMVLAAARTLADLVAPERLATGALYPPIAALRFVSRAVALAVAREAVASGLSESSGATLEAEIDAAMWWPDYVPYLPA